MSLPSVNGPKAQPSIRSFFQAKQPTYAAPPSASRPPPGGPPTTTPEAQLPRQLQPPHVNGVEKSSNNGDSASFKPSRPVSLHPNASIEKIQSDQVPALRRITSLLLPVNYPESFYARLSDPMSSGAFSRAILWSDPANSSTSPAGAAVRPKVIGGLVCRPEPSPFHPPSAEQPHVLYIQSLVLLSPYRSLGLAAAILDEVVTEAAAAPWHCTSVYAHVWTDNEEGLRWYLARGFVKQEPELKGYYHRLQPDSAWIVRKDIPRAGGPTAALQQQQQLPQQNGSVAAGSKPPGLPSAQVALSPTAAAANLPPASTPALLATSAPTPPASNGGGPPASGQSFQNTRPDMEWNDLPADMMGNPLAVPRSAVSSGASTKSSSAMRKKRDRAYPAAAFGQ